MIANLEDEAEAAAVDRAGIPGEEEVDAWSGPEKKCFRMFPFLEIDIIEYSVIMTHREIS